MGSSLTTSKWNEQHHRVERRPAQCSCSVNTTPHALFYNTSTETLIRGSEVFAPQLIRKGPLGGPPDRKHQGREEASQHAPMSVCAHTQRRRAGPDAHRQLGGGSGDSILQTERLKPGDLSK